MNSPISSMKLNLIFFKDEEAYYSYCPALDLLGYGDTENEAQKSFNIVLEEYIRYTTENQTLIEDLKSLGWKIIGNDKKLMPPKISECLNGDNEFNNIFNNYDFVKRSIPVEMPLV